MTDDFDELERIADSVHGDWIGTRRAGRSPKARRNFERLLAHNHELRRLSRIGYNGGRANPPITLPEVTLPKIAAPKIAAKCPAP